MANTTLLQVRTSEEDKTKAAEILESLGTNLSTVVNMLLKQIIITEGIPFEVKRKYPVYTADEELAEVKATLSLEDMDLTEDDMKILKEYRSGLISGDELRKKIINS